MDDHPLPPWHPTSPYVDVSDPVEVHYWARDLGVSDAHLLAAIRVAGPQLDDVARLLVKFGIAQPEYS